MEKTKKIPGKILGFLLTILTIVIVAQIIISSVFNFDTFTWPWQRESAIEAIALEDGLVRKTNRGLTPAETEEYRHRSDAPVADDVIRNFFVKETNQFVILYRESLDSSGNTIYPNISFVKTDDDRGLIWDGAWGVTCSLHTNWWTGFHDFKNATYNYNFNMSDYTFSTRGVVAKGILTVLLGSIFLQDQENIVTFSDPAVTFCTDFLYMNNLALNINIFSGQLEKDVNDLYKLTHTKLIDDIVSPYYEELTDSLTGQAIEMIIGAGETPEEKQLNTLANINSCATYMWQQTKTEDQSNNEKIVNISNYYANYIPEENETNYPIPVELQANYGDREYYSVFNSNIFADVTYVYDSTMTPIRDEKKIKEYTAERPIAEMPTSSEELSKLTIKLVNSNNSDLTNFDIAANPVEILIGGKNTIFDTSAELTNGVTIVVPKNTNLQYLVTSNGLVFDSYSGTLTLTTNSSSKSFLYTFNYNYVPVSVNLLPISSMDLTEINLTQNPVTVVLTGTAGEGTYNFVFNSIEKLNSVQTLSLKIGTYNWIINSNVLLFNEYSGTESITTSSRNINFTYFLEEEVVPFTLGLDITEAPLDGFGAVTFKLTSEAYNNLKSYLGVDNFSLDFTFFDSTENLISSKSITVNTTNTDTDIILERYIPSLLHNNNIYYCQIRARNGYVKTLTGEIPYFSYSTTKGYNFIVNTLNT